MARSPDGLTDFPNLEEGRGLQLSLTRGSALIWPTVNQDRRATQFGCHQDSSGQSY